MNVMNDFIKAIAYRLYQSFLISPILLYFLSGSLVLAVKFGFVEFFCKLFTYYIFERLWRWFDVRFVGKDCGKEGYGDKEDNEGNVGDFGRY